VEKLSLMAMKKNNRKIPIVTGTAIILIVIIDLLMSRQLLSYDNTTSTLMYILTLSGGYVVGSWILLEYSHNISKEIRKKSIFSNLMHWTVIVVQFSLFAILFVMLVFGNPGHVLSRSVFAVSSIIATVIMCIISFRFFAWYKLNKYKTPIVLFYAIAALTLAFSIAEDAVTKLVMVQVIQEKSPIGSVAESSFLYTKSERFNGQIIFKETKDNVTTLYIIPNSLLEIYNLLNSIVLPIGFGFRWIASTMLLRNIYRKISKLPLSLWIILSLPLILYLIGKMPGFFSGESLAGIDEAYRFYFRILFRAGTIAGNILFGLAFFIVARRLKPSKVKDYLILAGIGDTIVGISLSTSAIEPSYGVAAHSLVLLSSYLFTLGLYSSAISVSQDLRIRQSIRDSVIKESKLLASIGSAQMVQEIEKRVTSVVQNEKKQLVENTGIQPSFTEHDMKQYLKVVLKEIKIIQNIEEIVKKSRSILSESTEFSVCSKSSGLRLAFNNYFETYKAIITKQKNNEHNGIRLVTSIVDKDDATLVLRFVNMGIKVRHVKNLPPIDFALSDKEMIATIQKTEGGQAIQNLLTTNEDAYIKHFESIFEELWKSGIDAKYKIKDIQKGLDSEDIEIIQNPEAIEKLVNDLTKSSREEIVGIFSSSNAFRRQERSGSFEVVKDMVKLFGINVRILVPGDDFVNDAISQLNIEKLSNKIQIRVIDPSMQTKVSIMVIDKKHSLVIELRDDTKKTTADAIGLATYSNSKSTVLSYSSIFESLWKQTELNEHLQINDKMQKEFINTAAHELRTPIQPIIGIADLLKNTSSSEKDKELLDVISRNAHRLKKLAEDILDVTKIEGNSLSLNKESFRLIDIILENINNYKDKINNKSTRFELFLDKELTVYADKNSISRVISNLINNALKFTNKEPSIISIQAELKGTGKDEEERETIVINVRDNGSGIDEDVFPKLFTKFTSKSYHGIGLGLFISKKIVEAHGGRIWAENNKDGKGATFSFALPLNSMDNITIQSKANPK
jgi:signal transduction histidine kinase